MIKLKINWSVGLVITLAVFIVISLIMIFYFMNQKVDLVTDNYYEKTLHYQEQIDEAERSQQINRDIKFEYLSDQIQITFPEAINQIKDAEIYFYRPSDSSKDFKGNFDLVENNKIIVNLSKIDKGYWKVQLRWFMEDKSYSIERTLMIN